MVDHGLHDVIPTSDIILGQHVDHRREGTVTYRSGITIAAANSIKATVFGGSGHGSQHQHCIGPIVISSIVIVQLQTIISRIMT